MPDMEERKQSVGVLLWGGTYIIDDTRKNEDYVVLLGLSHSQTKVIMNTSLKYS